MAEQYPMEPKELNGKWYIEVDTKELGKVLLLDKSTDLPIPITFSTEGEALTHIRELRVESKSEE